MTSELLTAKLSQRWPFLPGRGVEVFLTLHQAQIRKDEPYVVAMHLALPTRNDATDSSWAATGLPR
jgi:hypothetical protein